MQQLLSGAGPAGQWIRRLCPSDSGQMGPSDSRATVGGPLVRWYPNEPEVGSKKYPKRPFYINIIYILYIYDIYGHGYGIFLS